MRGLAVYISTCDGYSDCWNPFFRLFERYWPDFSGTLYLSTEYKEYAYGNLPVVSQRLCWSHGVPTSERVPWSRFTRWALEAVPDDLVLFLQEDFFLKGTVRSEVVDRYAVLMREHPDIRCLHLTDQSVQCGGPSEFPGLDEVPLRQRYRVSCQCALWRKDEILSILRDDESAWEYEEFGSARSAALGHRYLAVSHDVVRLGVYEIVPYVFTGIVQGQWLPEVQPLFEANGVVVDYTVRGFHEGRRRKPFLDRVRYHLHRLVKKVRNEYDIRVHLERVA
ncbi:MAG: hypothetical protein IJ721_08810 [Bacteroidales bacterium]|nr:hypothetical protein [Bacteroidales bacterium]